MLLRMRDVISNGLLPPTEKNAATAMVDNTTPPASPRPLSAAKLCHLLVQFATQLSQLVPGFSNFQQEERLTVIVSNLGKKK